MRVGWLGLLLVTGGAWGAPMKVAAPGFSVVDVDPARASFLLEYLAQAMASDELRIVTAKEIASLVGAERQKELLGCGEEANSCIAELGAALGSEALLLGELAHIGKRYQFSIKVISAKDGAPLVSRSGKAESEEQLVDLLAEVGKQLGDALRARFALKPVIAAEAAAPRSSSRRLWWIPVAGGVVAAGGGAALMVISGTTARPLHESARLDIRDAAGIRDAANTQLTAGTALVVTGAVAALAGLGWWLFGPSSTRAAAFVGPGGGAIAISGALP